MRRAFLFGPRFGYNHLTQSACELCVFGRGVHSCGDPGSTIANDGASGTIDDRDGWQIVAASAAGLPCRVGWREQRYFSAVARVLGPLRVSYLKLPDGPTFSIVPSGDCMKVGEHAAPCRCVAIVFDMAAFGPGSFDPSIDAAITRLYEWVYNLRGGRIVRARPGYSMVYGPMDAERWAAVEPGEVIPSNWSARS